MVYGAAMATVNKVIGGKKLALALGSLEKKITSGGVLRVGVLEKSRYPAGKKGESLHVAQVAFWNEFGHKGRFPAPPRPFFRSMVASESGKWPAMMAQAFRANKMDGAKTLAFMGEEIDGALKQSIIDFTSPALSPTTLRLRLRFGNNPQNIRARDVVQAQREVAAGAPVASGTQAKPLINTGTMLQSTGYRVLK